METCGNGREPVRNHFGASPSGHQSSGGQVNSPSTRERRCRGNYSSTARRSLVQPSFRSGHRDLERAVVEPNQTYVLTVSDLMDTAPPRTRFGRRARNHCRSVCPGATTPRLANFPRGSRSAPAMMCDRRFHHARTPSKRVWFAPSSRSLLLALRTPWRTGSGVARLYRRPDRHERQLSDNYNRQKLAIPGSPSLAKGSRHFDYAAFSDSGTALYGGGARRQQWDRDRRRRSLRPGPRPNSNLVNISTRGSVQSGDNVLIAGTIVIGPGSTGCGARHRPSLPIAGKLQDPALELRNANGDLIRANDNWRSHQEPTSGDSDSADERF